MTQIPSPLYTDTTIDTLGIFVFLLNISNVNILSNPTSTLYGVLYPLRYFSVVQRNQPLETVRHRIPTSPTLSVFLLDIFVFAK